MTDNDRAAAIRQRLDMYQHHECILEALAEDPEWEDPLTTARVEVARLTAENKTLRERIANLEHVAVIADHLSHESSLGYSYTARELRAALRAVGRQGCTASE